MEKFYITTAIDYVNAPPHIGHAYEKIATDVIARHFRQRGWEVFFLTGVDEHGIKIEKTAANQGLSPQEFCDLISAKFRDAWKLLDISYSRFIRTTEEEHKKVVQHIFKTLLDKGDIYKAAYTGLYCTGCECFLSSRELAENNLCPVHLSKPQEVQEENYFFKLSKYKDRIKEHILNNPEFLQPEYRVNEVLNQLKETEDISVSRTKCSVNWGIPVPDDDNQIIYVWIDALSNYLTGIGYLNNEELYKKFWSPDVHIIGKDILKFHSIYWIAILMAMELPLPKTIYAHGWIIVNESKMSKTLGNVISPVDIMNEYNLSNADPVRYFLMTNSPFWKDANYSDEDFKNKVNADLANNLGNLLNRSLSMLVKYFDGYIISEAITDFDNSELAKMSDLTQKTVLEAFDKYNIFEAAAAILNLTDRANKHINESAPWSLAKNSETKIRCAQVLYDVLETLRQISIMIYPYIPNISASIFQQLSIQESIAESKWSDLKWGGLKSGKIISGEDIKPVFLRLDFELADDKKKK
ncbi:MAG: methionine--tRNA ligase [bacterium]